MGISLIFDFMTSINETPHKNTNAGSQESQNIKRNYNLISSQNVV